MFEIIQAKIKQILLYMYSENAFKQSRSLLSNVTTRWRTKFVALQNLNHADFWISMQFLQRRTH